MKYHKTVQKIRDLLSKNGVWFEAFEHEPVKTSEEAAKIRDGFTLKQGAKALIVRAKDFSLAKYFVMLVMPGDLRFNDEKIKKELNLKDIRFATEEEINEITSSIQIGGIPPFGNLFGLKVVVDPSLLKNEKIIFNAGDRCYSIAMKSVDYKRIVKPDILNIV